MVGQCSLDQSLRTFDVSITSGSVLIPRFGEGQCKRCGDGCIDAHVRKAKAAGATKAEIAEALGVAVALNAAGDRGRAADALLEAIRRDRAWNDEAARKQLLKFFEAWGFDDPATLAARRKLSSLLFR